MLQSNICFLNITHVCNLTGPLHILIWPTCCFRFVFILLHQGVAVACTVTRGPCTYQPKQTGEPPQRLQSN